MKFVKTGGSTAASWRRSTLMRIVYTRQAMNGFWFKLCIRGKGNIIPITDSMKVNEGLVCKQPLLRTRSTSSRYFLTFVLVVELLQM